MSYDAALDEEHVVLNDGRLMPRLGLGVWRTPEEDAQKVVEYAIKAGYRAIDTAMIYGNEAGVGRALAASETPVYLTTKLWNEDQGYDEALRAFEASAARLGRAEIELYLIHWPSPQRDRYVDSWRALAQLKADGRAKSIGVSNFNADHLRRVADATGVMPAVNQIELHPRFQQKALRALHAEHGVVTESWSPLGQGQVLSDPVVAQIARKYGKTPAQVVIRWHLDIGVVTIPKSVTPTRISENFDVMDFHLDAEDMALIETLDAPDGRIGPDPADANF